MQIGLTEAEVSGALLCLDVTPQIVEEAIRKGCNLIVSHHPLIFRKLKRIADENEVQKTVRLAIENHVAIVSMHTNLDAAIGGVNSKIAEKIGLQNTQFLGKQQNIDGVCAGEGVIGELSEELATTESGGNFNSVLLESKVKDAYEEVKAIRRYPKNMNPEFIEEDMEYFYSTVKRVARYDYNQIGGEGQSSYSADGVSIKYVNRDNFFKDVKSYCGRM